jgi:hypothetical protein
MVQNLTSLQISSHSLWQKEITQMKIIKKNLILLLKYPSQNNNNNNNEQDAANDTPFEKGVFLFQNHNLITQQQQQHRIECFNIAHAFMLSIIYTQKVAPIYTRRERERERGVTQRSLLKAIAKPK